MQGDDDESDEEGEDRMPNGNTSRNLMNDDDDVIDPVNVSILMWS